MKMSGRLAPLHPVQPIDFTAISAFFGYGYELPTR
jgi:hypothetical protein